jgi:hypothetical protein
MWLCACPHASLGAAFSREERTELIATIPTGSRVIVGSAVGALHGKNGFPAPWLEGLTGRTEEADDGRIFALLAEAEKVFGIQPRQGRS